MLKGRLGLETARIPHANRHGLLWLSRGALTVRDGSLRFERQSSRDSDSDLDEGEYGIPFQALSMILLGPGSTVSHDAMRLMARHGTGLIAVGEDGVRCYTAPPLNSDTSELARKQMEVWALPEERIEIARKMYALRLGETFPHEKLDVLRGMEGARMKRTYQILASSFKITWQGRRYDRGNPMNADIPNQAINHASVAVTAAAIIAVTATGTIPQLGFIHEHSSDAFALDIADLFRHTVLLPAAFKSAKMIEEGRGYDVERLTRRNTGEMLRSKRVISKMIDSIKLLFQDVPLEEPVRTVRASLNGRRP